MKLLIVLALVVLAVASPDGDHYDSKYDSFNVDELIQSPRLLKSYAHCFIGDGKCTPEGKEFKGESTFYSLLPFVPRLTFSYSNNSVAVQ